MIAPPGYVSPSFGGDTPCASSPERECTRVPDGRLSDAMLGADLSEGDLSFTAAKIRITASARGACPTVSLRLYLASCWRCHRRWAVEAARPALCFSIRPVCLEVCASAPQVPVALRSVMEVELLREVCAACAPAVVAQMLLRESFPRPVPPPRRPPSVLPQSSPR